VAAHRRKREGVGLPSWSAPERAPVTSLASRLKVTLSDPSAGRRPAKLGRLTLNASRGVRHRAAVRAARASAPPRHARRSRPVSERRHRRRGASQDETGRPVKTQPRASYSPIGTSAAAPARARARDIEPARSGVLGTASSSRSIRGGSSVPPRGRKCARCSDTSKDEPFGALWDARAKSSSARRSDRRDEAARWSPARGAGGRHVRPRAAAAAALSSRQAARAPARRAHAVAVPYWLGSCVSRRSRLGACAMWVRDRNARGRAWSKVRPAAARLTVYDGGRD